MMELFNCGTFLTGLKCLPTSQADIVAVGCATEK